MDTMKQKVLAITDFSQLRDDFIDPSSQKGLAEIAKAVAKHKRDGQSASVALHNRTRGVIW